jgi:DNA-binding NtrC family response regulator
VDDEAEFVATLAKRMRARGLEVDTAPDGETAITLSQAEPYDVVVLDLAMPGMDGLETLTHLQGIDNETQVILLTGHGNVPKCVEAMKHGATDFLEKPTKFNDLLEKVTKAARQRRDLAEQHMDEHMADIMSKKGW